MENAWILYEYMYVLIINIIGFLMMYLDKQKAIHHRYRIKEATLFLIAIIGGGLGSLLGMYVFHHKTKKWYFMIGIPLILVIEIAIYLILI